MTVCLFVILKVVKRNEESQRLIELWAASLAFSMTICLLLIINNLNQQTNLLATIKTQQTKIDFFN